MVSYIEKEKYTAPVLQRKSKSWVQPSVTGIRNVLASTGGL
jgi:hypothetical protein